MGFILGSTLAGLHGCVYCFNSVFIREGMLKSSRPQFMRDFFTQGSRAQYPSIMPQVANFYFMDVARNSLGALVFIGTVSQNALLGNPATLAIYVMGGFIGAFSWMIQRRYKPYPLDSRYDRACFASAGVGAVACTALAFPTARVWRNIPLLPFAILWLAQSTLQEYITTTRMGNKQEGVVRQQGMVGSIAFGLSAALFIISRRSSLRLAARIKPAPSSALPSAPIPTSTPTSAIPKK